MLYNRYFSVFCVFLCAVCAGSASADEAAVKKAIQAQYDKGDKAMLAGNADAYVRICTPDATFLAPRHKPETLKELKSHIGPNPDPDSIVISDRHTIQKLKIDKTGAMAEVDAEEIMSGTIGPEDKKHSWSVISHTECVKYFETKRRYFFNRPLA